MHLAALVLTDPRATLHRAQDLVAQRDGLRAAVEERSAFLGKSAVELQALASDINTLLLNADPAADTAGAPMQ